MEKVAIVADWLAGWVLAIKERVLPRLGVEVSSCVLHSKIAKSMWPDFVAMGLALMGSANARGMAGRGMMPMVGRI